MTASSNKKLPPKSERKKKAKKSKSDRAAQSGRVRRSNILVLEENTQGKDIIIGDVHGAKSLLQKLIDEKLKDPNNRLFIVGDLIDRGEDSLGVIQLIEQANKKRREQGLADQIYVVRGNHEEQLLAVSEPAADSTKEWRAHCKAVYFRNGGDWIQKIKPEQLKQAVKFVKTLPYIIHVKGNRSFHIVHADMPINDFALQKRIQQGCKLRADEKKYATWAREDSPVIAINSAVVGRTIFSVPTFCGHKIHGRQRPETNTTNLDVGACFTNTFITVEFSSSGHIECHTFEDDLPKPVLHAKLTRKAQNQQEIVSNLIAALPSKLDEIAKNINKSYEYLNELIKVCKERDGLELDIYIRASVRQLNPFDAKAEKNAYLQKLSEMVVYLSPEKKRSFAQYLVQHQDTHLLAQERHWFRGYKHCIETRSMHKALNLLGAVKYEAGKFVVQGAAQEEQTAQTSYELTRHVKLFR